MSSRKAAAVIAALLFVVGLAVGLWPITVAGDISCGSAFSPHTLTAQAKTDVARITDAGADDYAAMCDDAIGTRRWIALPLVGAGALAGLFLVLTNVRADESAAARSRPTPR